MNDNPTNAAYDDIVRFVGLGWITYRNKASSAANMPGQPSYSGKSCDALEGFSRTMPLFAAWCASNRPATIEINGRSLNLTEEFRRGLLAGTDQESPYYWGNMVGDSNQRIVEAADVALALWLLREQVWEKLSIKEQQQVKDWLGQAKGKMGHDNNWQLFFVLIDRVLNALGFSNKIDGVVKRYHRVKQFYVGGGWFSDGPGGPIDYYNVWGFHYALTWIDRIDPDWDPVFISEVRRAFVADFKYFIGPRGFPAFGRSLCYRLAIVAPLVSAAGTDPDIVTAGAARRALNVTWTHFVTKGAFKRGTITQGYYKADMRMLDPYSGPASSFWSLRSLVMAYSFKPDHAFWTAAPEPIPIEQGAFEKELPEVGWRIAGCQETGVVTLSILANRDNVPIPLEHIGLTDRLRCALGLKRRPENFESKYKAPSYSSEFLIPYQ